MKSTDTFDRIDTSLFVAGALLVLVSLTAAVWMLSLGDVVTALGLGLLVAAGVLLTGIGLSPEAARH
jgi:hypothetical protein